MNWEKRFTGMLNTRKASNYSVLFDLKQNKTSLSQENLFIHRKKILTVLYLSHLFLLLLKGSTDAHLHEAERLRALQFPGNGRSPSQ